MKGFQKLVPARNACAGLAPQKDGGLLIQLGMTAPAGTVSLYTMYTPGLALAMAWALVRLAALAWWKSKRKPAGPSAVRLA